MGASQREPGVVDDEPELVEHRRPEHAGERKRDVGVGAVVVADCLYGPLDREGGEHERPEDPARRAKLDDALREPFLTGVAGGGRSLT